MQVVKKLELARYNWLRDKLTCSELTGGKCYNRRRNKYISYKSKIDKGFWRFWGGIEWIYFTN